MKTATPIRFFRGRMARTMLLIFLPISLLPLLLMGSMAYLYGSDLVRQQAYTLVTTIVDSQANRIDTQVKSAQLLLSQSVYSTALNEELETALLLEDASDPAFSASRQAIINELKKINLFKSHFNQFLIILPDGRIHIATRRDWQGQHISDNFISSLDSTISIADFAPDPLYSDSDEIDSFVFMTAVPLFNKQGYRVAIILGIAESPVIWDIIEAATFYSDEHYFVTNDGRFIGLNPHPDSFKKLIFLQPSETHQGAISEGLNDSQISEGDSRPNVKELISFQGQPVIAAHTWMPELQVGWGAEVLKSRVYGQIDAMVRFSIIILLITGVAIGLIIWYVTRHLTRPILDLAETVKLYAEGNWEQRALVHRQDEIGQLAFSFNQMADEQTSLYRVLEAQVEERTEEIHTISQLSQVAISASSLDELLRSTISLIIRHFDCSYAAVFLVEGSNSVAFRHGAGSPDIMNKMTRQNVAIELRLSDHPHTLPSLVGWVVAMNQPRAGLVHLDADMHTRGSRSADIPDMPSIIEAAIPIAVGSQVLGALNLYAISTEPMESENSTVPFSDTVISELQTIANQIASAVKNFQLLEATQTNLQEANLLYQASYQIAQAETVEQVLTNATRALQQTPYPSVILLAEGNILRIVSNTLPGIADRGLANLRSGKEQLSVSREVTASYFPSANPILIGDISSIDAGQLPEELLEMPRQMGCNAAAFLPVIRGGELLSILILGNIHRPPSSAQPTSTEIRAAPFTLVSLQPYTNLIALVTTVLEKIQAQEGTQRRLAELETLWNISQTVSIETDLTSLYQGLHKQTEQIMGELSSFGIALYDADTNLIHIPYMVEEGQFIDFPPFPLGEGLTSILLRSGRPLLLVEDTEAQVKALGAKTVGALAKSWLGVPLMLGGKALGAIIVQDIHQENRFNEEDQRLLSTMAAQVAVVVHNARLLDSSRHQAEQEKALFEITNKIRHSVDIQSVLKTTAEELGAALGAHRAHIEIQVNTPPPSDGGKTDKKAVDSQKPREWTIE